MKSFPAHVIASLLLAFTAGGCGANGKASIGPGDGGNSPNGGSTSSNGGNSTAAGGTTSRQTGNGGTSSTGGAEATGGQPETGGADAVTGGSKATGGTKATGGNIVGGGTTTTGGSVATGGKAAGGTAATGGNNATGGSVTTDGTKATGGTIATGGSKATGGNSATGGTTVTGPRTCTFPSSWKPGNPTYTTYTLPNATTACGYNGSNNNISNIANGQYFAAIPGNTSSDFNTSNRCGACVKIGNAVITIVDECPNDSNQPCKNNPSGHLDLSQSGAGAAGVQGDPNKQGQNAWNFVPCPVNGNVKVRLKNGNNNEFFLENEILPIQSINCGGQSGSRTSYGAWHFGANVNGTSCTATDIGNATITFTVGSQQGQDVDTGVQFQKCS